MTVQIRNAELVDLLRPDFIHRNEPNVAWSHAVSMHRALPGLRGFWPMSGFDGSGMATDMGSLGHHLAYNGNPYYGYSNLVPYVHFDGVGDYLEHLDHADFDITGTESFVPAAQQGLSVGGWFYFDGLGNLEAMMSKYGLAIADESWRLTKVPTDVARFVVSDGAATTVVTSTTTLSAATWYFMAGVFSNSANTISVWLDNVYWSAAFNNTINNSTVAFRIGMQADGNNPFVGRASLCWVCATALSDAIVKMIYHWTRSMFGKVSA
jgi:hypothetical protein